MNMQLASSIRVKRAIIAVVATIIGAIALVYSMAITECRGDTSCAAIWTVAFFTDWTSQPPSDMDAIPM